LPELEKIEPAFLLKGFFDEDVIHIIKKLGKQLATLVLDGGNLTDDAHLYLNNCVR
jgi:hypothetical protein